MLLLLALDLGVFHRKIHIISIKEAFFLSAFWIALALVFNVLVYNMYECHFSQQSTSIQINLSGLLAQLNEIELGMQQAIGNDVDILSLQNLPKAYKLYQEATE